MSSNGRGTARSERDGMGAGAPGAQGAGVPVPLQGAAYDGQEVDEKGARIARRRHALPLRGERPCPGLVAPQRQLAIQTFVRAQVIELGDRNAEPAFQLLKREAGCLVAVVR